MEKVSGSCMGRNDIVRVVLWQHALVAVSALVVGLFFGFEAAISSLLGGFCVSVPNGLFALSVMVSQLSGRVWPKGVLVGEFLKMLATCMAFVLVAKYFPSLIWPAMIFGIVVAISGSFVPLFVKH